MTMETARLLSEAVDPPASVLKAMIAGRAPMTARSAPVTE